MPDIEDKLVIAIASSAVCPLDEETKKIFREQGEAAYRKYQREHEDEPLPRGPAFSFVKRLLRLNELLGDNYIDVVLLSRNDCDTGLRIIKTLRTRGITQEYRAMFLDGKDPCDFLETCDSSLFLTEKQHDVERAASLGFAAGQVLAEGCCNDEEGDDLRIAFDFDGVLADSTSERKFQQSGLNGFIQYEQDHRKEPHHEGPMARLFKKLARLRELENQKMTEDPNYHRHLNLSIVTARGILSCERVVTTLRSWDILPDQGFFLSSARKDDVLKQIQPHIYFDDKLESNLLPIQHLTACVHVPQLAPSNAP
ncbi:MAG: 5'-nucleotidase [Victivallales bacterium]|nr:5'-nucleotidase [Victivallales bacterium]